MNKELTEANVAYSSVLTQDSDIIIFIEVHDGPAPIIEIVRHTI